MAAITNDVKFSVEMNQTIEIISRLTKLTKKVAEDAIDIYVCQSWESVSGWVKDHIVTLHEIKTISEKTIDFFAFVNLLLSIGRLISAFVEGFSQPEQEQEGEVDADNMQSENNGSYLRMNIVKEILLTSFFLGKVCVRLDQIRLIVLSSSQKVFCRFVIPSIKIFISLFHMFNVITMLRKLEPQDENSNTIDISGKKYVLTEESRAILKKGGIAVLIKELSRLLSACLVTWLLLINTCNLFIAIGFYVSLDYLLSYIQYLIECACQGYLSSLDRGYKNILVTL